VSGRAGVVGCVRPVQGELPGDLAARETGHTLIVPAANAEEACLASGLKVIAVHHLLELADTKEYRFFDSGRSAYTGKRISDEGEFGRFLSLVNDAQIKPGSYLLVESLDRLSGDRVNIALAQLLNLLRTGIKVVTLSDERTYSNDSPDLATELIVSIAVMVRVHNESSGKANG
jgi:hypothetical protein